MTSVALQTGQGSRDSAALAARFTTAPVVADSEEARRRVAEWLAETAPGDAEALQALFARYPLAGTIVQSLAEASPFLFDLARFPGRLSRVLAADPEPHLAGLIAAAVAGVAAAEDDAVVMRLLRQMKAEAALLIALADIGGVWPVMQVTGALTAIADTAVRCAIDHQLAREARRGRIHPADAANPAADSTLIVLAMGKMGAGELNYSSDIDLIVFFDAAAPTLSPDLEPPPFFVRVAQGLSRLLSQRTEDGYVFRVDLRLRPDPGSTPVAVSTAAALAYYEREGRTWERAAMIKARPCAGDLNAGRAVLTDIAPFIWRRHLDYAALADVHDMKRQMHSYKGHSEIAVEGHNIKLGRGGIREIEFFVQTQQLIAGGRHPELRVRGTLEALDVLAAGGWVAPAVRDELAESYQFLRKVEHRVQMMHDEQTHSLPEERAAIEQFARFLGFADRDAFAAALLRHLNRVQNHYGRLFEPVAAASSAALPEIDYAAGPEDIGLLEHLSGLGYRKPVQVAGIVADWIKGEYRALKAEGPRRALAGLLPTLLHDLARGDDPDGAIVLFDRFLDQLKSGARLFALLQQNSDLVSLVALMLSAAPRLGDMLARQPQLLDGLIDPRFFGALPNRDEISERLAATLADAPSYEEFLDRMRAFGQESLFLIGTRILAGTVSAQQAGEAFADVAEGIVRTVHREVEAQFAAAHGRIRGQQTAILAMGKLGSREMTASSDLDLIVIYDYDHDAPDSDGARPLTGSQYFARLTHRLISAFTTRTNVGVLYEVDMRLRPSGRAGPVATSIQAFADYQDNEAWTWEHLALTRARVVSATPEFRARIEAIIAGVLRKPRKPALIGADVAEMRQAIAAEKGESDAWDIKNAKGGLTDIEFIAQFLQLAYGADTPGMIDTNTTRVLDKAERRGVLAVADAEVLRPAARLYHNLTQVLRLCLDATFKPDEAGSDLKHVLTRAADEPEFSALDERLRETEAAVRAVFLRIVAGGEG